MCFLHGSKLNEQGASVLLKIVVKLIVFGLVLVELDIDCYSWIALFLDVDDMLGNLMHLRH
jgi:hypothetical protein